MPKIITSAPGRARASQVRGVCRRLQRHGPRAGHQSAHVRPLPHVLVRHALRRIQGIDFTKLRFGRKLVG
jgi:hypothetical protein